MTPPKITGHRVSFPEQRLLVYSRALRLWGPRRQVAKALEEILEAALEVQRALQNPLAWIAPPPGKGETETQLKASPALVSEVADLLIMAEQLRLIVGPARVDHEAAAKIDRTAARLLKLELELAPPEPVHRATVNGHPCRDNGDGTYTSEGEFPPDPCQTIPGRIPGSPPAGTRLPGPPPQVDFAKLAAGAGAFLSATLAWGTPPQVEPGPEDSHGRGIRE